MIISETDKYVTVDEGDKLRELFTKAQGTPVILLFGKTDISKNAWDLVRDYMEELASKYEVDVEKPDGTRMTIKPDNQIVYARG